MKEGAFPATLVAINDWCSGNTLHASALFLGGVPRGVGKGGKGGILGGFRGVRGVGGGCEGVGGWVGVCAGWVVWLRVWW